MSTGKVAALRASVGSPRPPHFWPLLSLGDSPLDTGFPGRQVAPIWREWAGDNLSVMVHAVVIRIPPHSQRVAEATSRLSIQVQVLLALPASSPYTRRGAALFRSFDKE